MSTKKVEETVTKTRKDIILQTITAIDGIVSDTEEFAFKARENHYVLEHMTKITYENGALNDMVCSIVDIVDKAHKSEILDDSTMVELRKSLEAIEIKYEPKEQKESKK